MIKTADGHYRKENPKVTEEIQNSIVKFKLAIQRGKAMESLKDHEGWHTIQDVLNDRLKVVEKYLDNFSEKEQRWIDFRLQEKKDLKFFVSIVDDFLESIPIFESHIEQWEKSLSERKPSSNPED
jgi:hypothetical protein